MDQSRLSWARAGPKLNAEIIQDLLFDEFAPVLTKKVDYLRPHVHLTMQSSRTNGHMLRPKEPECGRGSLGLGG